MARAPRTHIVFAVLLWPGSAIVKIEKVALVDPLEDDFGGLVERTMPSNVFWCWKRRP
jgi:hypothetical protein